MSEPFLAQIKIVGFNFAPRGWALCDGQILPIAQNNALFSLLGTTYGGDGRTSFALPDLRGRVPIHEGQDPGGSNHALGSKAGDENLVLSELETPAHNHSFNPTSTDGDSPIPIDTHLGAFNNGYIDDSVNPADLVPLRNEAVTTVGGGHNNMQPYLTLSFCIALQGTFPSRN